VVSWQPMNARIQFARISAASAIATHPLRPQGPMKLRHCLACWPAGQRDDCLNCGGYGCLFQLRDTKRWLTVDDLLTE
jgi:hypothetical protein